MSLRQSGENEFLNRLTAITEANLTNVKFGVSDLAREMGMSRSNLHRKLKSASGLSISQFMRKIRLERAMEMLEHTSLTISDIAFESGFHSVTYFTKCFHDFYGYSPGKIGNGDPGKNNLKDPQGIVMGRGIWENRYFRGILIVVMVLLVIGTGLTIVFKPFTSGKNFHDKSIAVLPFINDSPEEAEMYFINGTMDAILNHLSKIEAIRVISRTSVEQYRGHSKSISEIAKEMNVSYILEGSGIKHGDNIRLTVQLIDAINDRHIWSESYDRKIDEVFELYSEVAQLIAKELEAKITPEEKQRIERLPTSSIVAYEFFQKGEEEEWKYRCYGDVQALQQSRVLFEYALEYDSTFAEPYVSIAWNYWLNHVDQREPSQVYLDTILMIVEKALTLDDQLAAAYNLRGYYHRQIDEDDKAIEDFKKALQLDPNMYNATNGLAYINWEKANLLETITYFHQGTAIDRGPQYPYSLILLGRSYFMAGYKDQANYYFKLAVDITSDSATYYFNLALSEFYITNNHAKSLDLLKRGNKIDPENTRILQLLGTLYLHMGQYRESVDYYEKYLDKLNEEGRIGFYVTHYIALAYWRLGDREKAEYYFDQQKYYCEQRIPRLASMHKILGEIYAFRGDKEKALEHLRIFNMQERRSVYSSNFSDEILFDNIRDDPEFQQIARDLEAKYQAEHERVGKWLEENDMLKNK
jgi:TolB-like protein/AraC-like DNA-binding protein